MKVTSILLSIFCAGYSLYIVGTGKDQGQYKSDFIISDVIDGGNRLELDDIKDVRSDFYDCMDNMGMFWQIPTIQAFQSVVPGSIMEFYESVGVERSVASRPEADYYGLRSFLSCKYLLITMANSEMLSQRKQRCHTGHISINRIILMFIQMIAIFHMVSPMMNILQKSSMNSVPNLTVTCSCSKLWFSQMSKLKIW